MLQEPSPQQYELEMVTMEQLVPKDHLVRKIDSAIDFEFIRDEVAHLYCKDNGRPPVDPVRLFKIILLGYIFGVKSERQLVKEIEVNVAYRWFLRMSLTEKVIHASTLSQNRIRRFNGTDVFERIFINIVQQAMAKGLVAGQELFTDSTHLKANANKNKHTNKQTAVRASAYLDMLDEDVALDRAKEGKRPLKERTSEQKAKNTKSSTTDPESGFMTRDNKPQGFFYLDHRTVDGQHGIIVDTHATAGNVNDSQPYIRRLDHTLEQFNLNPIAVGLDAGYFTAPVAESLERRGILGVFGYRRPSRTKNAFNTLSITKKKTAVAPTGRRRRHATLTESITQTLPAMRDDTQSKNMKLTRHIIRKWIEPTRCGSQLLQAEKRGKRSFADAKQHHGQIRSLSTNVQMQCWLASQNIKKIAWW